MGRGTPVRAQRAENVPPGFGEFDQNQQTHQSGFFKKEFHFPTSTWISYLLYVLIGIPYASWSCLRVLFEDPVRGSENGTLKQEPQTGWVGRKTFENAA